MEARDIALLPANEVRRDNKLMRLYIEKYKDVFFSEPDCASCTFQRDFIKFKQAVLYSKVEQSHLTSNTMEDQTFVLNRQYRNDIHTYVKDRRPFRSYGYNMTEDFAVKYLTEGTKKQIEERKEKFVTLPEAVRPKPKKEEKKTEKKAEKKTSKK